MGSRGPSCVRNRVCGPHTPCVIGAPQQWSWCHQPQSTVILVTLASQDLLEAGALGRLVAQPQRRGAPCIPWVWRRLLPLRCPPPAPPGCSSVLPPSCRTDAEEFQRHLRQEGCVTGTLPVRSAPKTGPEAPRAQIPGPWHLSEGRTWLCSPLSKWRLSVGQQGQHRLAGLGWAEGPVLTGLDSMPLRVSLGKHPVRTGLRSRHFGPERRSCCSWLCGLR